MLMKTFNNAAYIGVPRPVTGSQPLAAENPFVLQPALVPVVISWKASGCAYWLLLDNCQKDLWSDTYQRRVDETNSRFSSCDSLLIDQVEDRSEDRRRRWGTTNESRSTSGEDNNVISNGSNIWVTSTTSIIDSTILANGNIISRIVGLVWGRTIGEIAADSALLVWRPGIYVGL